MLQLPQDKGYKFPKNKANVAISWNIMNPGLGNAISLVMMLFSYCNYAVI